jgi:hypothetical protein
MIIASMSEPEFIADEATAGRAESVIETMTSALETLNSRGSVDIVRGRDKVFLLAYGWWAFIVRSSEAVVVLRRANLGHEASPIVRGILQHGMVLQWLVDTGDDAVDAVAEYGDDNVRKLLNTMTEAKWPPVEGLTMTAPPAPTSPNLLVHKIEDFSQLCVAYDARRLYVPFRLLSAYVHPTMVGARAYINETTVELSSIALSDDNPLVIQTAMCLIQATKVISQLFAGDPLRAAIAQAEETLGIEVGLWSPRKKSQ